jgi:NAD-dependent dihydropyrimidine dehydrogenase PreA subunit
MSNYGTWQGIPRENVPWHPTVDAAKCLGCKECYNFCRQKVYGWDTENNKTRVAEPFRCVVGCSTCAGLCKEGAISFPPLTVLQNLKG